MKKILVCALAALTLRLYAFEVQVSEFQSTAEITQTDALDSADFSRNLFQAIAAKESRGLIGFRSRDRKETGGIVKSELDAMKACEIHGWEILVYGQVSAKSYGYDVEVRIYSHPERAVLKTFLLRSAAGDKSALIDDTAARVYGFFADLLQVEKEKPVFVAEGDAIVTSHALEWWGVVSPWNESMIAIAGYDGRIGFRLGNPIWTNGHWAWFQEYGFNLAFHFGTGRTGSLDANIYDFDIGPNMTWAFVRQRKTEVLATVEPCAKIHLLKYQPLYEETGTDAWVWYGLKFDAEYRVWLNSRRSAGMGLRAGLSAFIADPAYLEYRVGACFAWKGLTK